MKLKLTVLIVITLVRGVSETLADERPPSNALPLSEIVKSLESSGFSPITEISFDDGVWEVEAVFQDEERELKIDPVNMDIISNRLDD